jgi:hypothetical protein
MKKLVGLISIVLVMSLLAGCFGNFALTRKVYTWNDTISDNQFVKTIVFYALNFIPVYSVAGMVDVCILNLVEFWTGSNPMACNGLEQQIIYVDGNQYRMEATETSVKMEQLTGEKTGQLLELKYNDTDSTLEMITLEGSKIIGTYENDGLHLINPDGSTRLIRM